MSQGEKRRGKENMNLRWFQQGRKFPTYKGISREARESQRPQYEIGAPWIHTQGIKAGCSIFHSSWACDLQQFYLQDFPQSVQPGVVRSEMCLAIIWTKKWISLITCLREALKFSIWIITLLTNYNIGLKVQLG